MYKVRNYWRRLLPGVLPPERGGVCGGEGVCVGGWVALEAARLHALRALTYDIHVRNT